MTASTPLLLLQLLASRQLKPGAIAISFGSGAMECISSNIITPDLSKLSETIPCLISSINANGLREDIRQALLDAGCHTVGDDDIQLADGKEKLALLAQTRWLQGDWYLAPPPKPSGSQAASRTLALKLVQLVNADADTREIEDIFRRDPTLSYHLLRLVNSLAMGVGKRITSFSQAILILGRAQLKRWLNLMLFSARKDDQRGAMLLARVAVRARSMELLAKACGRDKATQEIAFMAGMFSLLGTLFGLPVAEVLKPLQVSEALESALLRGEGEFGEMLKAIICAELVDDAGIAGQLNKLQLSTGDFNAINLEAHLWMLSITRDSEGSGNAG